MDRHYPAASGWDIGATRIDTAPRPMPPTEQQRRELQETLLSFCENYYPRQFRAEPTRFTWAVRDMVDRFPIQLITALSTGDMSSIVAALRPVAERIPDSPRPPLRPL